MHLYVKAHAHKHGTPVTYIKYTFFLVSFFGNNKIFDT